MSDRRLQLGFAATAAAWTLVLALGDVHEALLYLLPALLLAIPLLAGRYPGERALARAVERARQPSRARPTAAPPSPRPLARLARGGRLIGSSLAGRAPPAATAVTH